MTARVHAVAPRATTRPHQCHWCWHWSGVVLRCDDDAIPGGLLCATHEIEHQRHLEERHQ